MPPSTSKFPSKTLLKLGCEQNLNVKMNRWVIIEQIETEYRTGSIKNLLTFVNKKN